MQVQSNSLSLSILTELISLQSWVCFAAAPSLSKSPEALQSQGTVICASLWYTCHIPLSPHLSYQNASLFSEDSESGIFAILAQGYSSDSAPSWRNPLSAARLAVVKVPTLEATKRCFPLQGHHYQHHHPHCYGSNNGPTAPSLTRMAIFYCKANLAICSFVPCEDYRQTGISAVFWIA